MGKCSVCKKTVVSGYVVCGSCSKNALSGRFAPELAFYINELAKDLAQTLVHCTDTTEDDPAVQECSNEVKSWLEGKAEEYFSRTVNV